LGREFATPEEAMADEDRLPSIISTYQNDLVKMKRTGIFAGKEVDDDLIQGWKGAIAGYEKQWEEVQKQRSE
jgi:hypothetical protein